MYYQSHLFFCTHLRQSGKQCCGGADAEELRQYTKKKIKSLGRHKAGDIRVNASGCLDRCSEGPILVIYPEGTWYSYKTYKDVDEIIEKHVLKGEIVERLQLSAVPMIEKKDK